MHELKQAIEKVMDKAPVPLDELSHQELENLSAAIQHLADVFNAVKNKL